MPSWHKAAFLALLRVFSRLLIPCARNLFVQCVGVGPRAQAGLLQAPLLVFSVDSANALCQESRCGAGERATAAEVPTAVEQGLLGLHPLKAKVCCTIANLF